MIVVGLNLGETHYSKSLKDGGVCIIDNGKIALTIAEERISRNKYGCGFEKSLPFCLHQLGLTLGEVDIMVVSSCCESIRNPKDIPVNGDMKPHEVYSINHHYSHALSSYMVSPFDEALIVIMDGGGNLLDNDVHEWWSVKREQSSYYIGKGNNIKLIDRDFESPFESGFGEVYRYFTHHLGWATSDAGKVMALAAYGNPKKFSDKKIFDFDPETGDLTCRIRNIPLDDLNLYDHLRALGYGDIPPRKPEDEITQIHMDLARHVQDEIECAIATKLIYLSKITGIKNACLAGGVALNCVANEKILSETPIENIFIQPAAGDQGQSIGNAIYGSMKYGEWKNPNVYFNPYLGPNHDWEKEISTISFNEGIVSQRIETWEKLIDFVARRLTSGKLVGWVQGNSEVGPRALGNRSILADPRCLATRTKLNSIKNREWFMPIAPSLLEEDLSRYFDTNISSPYMLRAVRATDIARKDTPAVIHHDGTSRIQTVNQRQNPIFYELLQRFKTITNGIPMLANTSFNRRGEPIVETARDALDAFLGMDLDILVIGNRILEKSRLNC